MIANAGSRTVVLAFDGRALADPPRIRLAAARLAAAQDEGCRVVAVLAAMGDATDDLMRLARDVSPTPRPRELDLLVTTGARISCALTAMALIDLGRRAVSLTGSQAGIVTDDAHGAAAILDVRPHRIERELLVGAIVLVADRQGVSTSSEVTALDRERAGATALALATALGAVRCELVTGHPQAAASPIHLPDAGSRLQHAV